MKKQVCLSGWGLVRVVETEGGAGHTEDVYWEPRWVALESGSLLWYLDEMQIFPEDIVALVDSCVQTQRQLENGEIILVCRGESMQGHSVVVELGVPLDESVFWKQAIDLHVETLFKMGTVVSPADLTMDDVATGEDGTAASSIRVSIKGESYTLVVKAEDDVPLIARRFVEENGLKKELDGVIERELFKAQVNGCLLRENKLKKQVSQVRRRLGDVALAEGRAAHAEQHAATLAVSLQSIEHMVPQIHDQLEEARKTIIEREFEIKELQRQLQEEDTLVHRLAKESDEIAESMHDLQQETKKIKEERDELETKLQLLEARQAESSSANHNLQDHFVYSAPSSPNLPSAPAPGSQSSATGASEPPNNMIQELRRSNVTLTQQLLRRDVEIKKLKLDLKTAVAEVVKTSGLIKGKPLGDLGGSPTRAETPQNANLELQYKRKIASLEEKVKSLSGSLKASDDDRAKLQVKVDEGNATVHHVQTQMRRGQDELASAVQELKELRLNATLRNYDSIMAENRSLRDELIRYRGEVLRLQARIDEVQVSAVQAVQSLQLLGPRVLMSDISSTNEGQGSTFSLSRSSSFRLPGAAYRDENDQRRLSQQAEESKVASDFQFLDLSTSASSSKTPVTQRNPPNPSVGSLGLNSSPSTTLRKSSDLSSELQNKRDEGVKYIWEPSFDVATARISPVVEDRLLHNIYNRYVGDAAPHMGTTTLMTLSKFGRFTKDFGISIIAKGGAAQPPFLVNGEIDIIFLNATQVIPEDRDLPERAPRAFGVRAGAGDDRKYKKSTVGAAGSAPVISAGQFIAAVKVLACQLYANVIEHETGTVLNCLPPRQRDTAIRAVMDILLKKKLVPTAEKLGLVPWPLIYLDQAMTVLTSHSDSAESLSRNFFDVCSWFRHYTHGHEPGNNRSNTLNLSYKSLSHFAHDFGIVPYLIKEPQLFRSVKNIQFSTFRPPEHPHLHHALTLSHVLYTHQHHTPTLYSLFKECQLWIKSEPTLLMACLPHDVQAEINSAGAAYSDTPSRSAIKDQDFINLQGFTALLLSAATQGFPDVAPEARIMRLFEFCRDSGGATILAKQS